MRWRSVRRFGSSLMGLPLASQAVLHFQSCLEIVKGTTPTEKPLPTEERNILAIFQVSGESTIQVGTECGSVNFSTRSSDHHVNNDVCNRRAGLILYDAFKALKVILHRLLFCRSDDFFKCGRGTTFKINCKVTGIVTDCRGHFQIEVAPEFRFCGNVESVFAGRQFWDFGRAIDTCVDHETWLPSKVVVHEKCSISAFANGFPSKRTLTEWVRRRRLQFDNFYCGASFESCPKRICKPTQPLARTKIGTRRI